MKEADKGFGESTKLQVLAACIVLSAAVYIPHWHDEQLTQQVLGTLSALAIACAGGRVGQCITQDIISSLSQRRENDTETETYKVDPKDVDDGSFQ